MSLHNLLRYPIYSVLILVLAYFAFDLWRPSILLVGNVTIDVIGNTSKPKFRPGGAYLQPCMRAVNRLCDMTVLG